MLSLSELPLDVLHGLLEHFDAKALARLSCCSRALRDAVTLHGWPLLARRLARPTHTLRIATSKWTARDVVRHSLALDKAWDCIDAALIQIGPTWTRKALPLLQIDERTGRLLFATGPELHVVGFDDLARPYPVLQRPERIGRGAVDDITGLAVVPGSNEAVVGTLTDALHRVRVTSRVERLATYGVHASLQSARSAGAIQSVSTSNDLIAAVSTPRAGSRTSSYASDPLGTLSLHALRSPWQPPDSLSLDEKPWSVHLSSYVAVGCTGLAPLKVFDLSETGFAGSERLLGGPDFRSSVYAFASLPSESPQVLLSGWYDGFLRIHDLRRSSNEPVLEVADKWSEDAIYSLAASSYDRVLIGGSRHSAIRIADVRSPAHIHTTVFCGNDESPVYSLAVEASRIFAVTDRRTMMVDFKPGAVEGYHDKSPPWAQGARPRYARAEEALRLRVYGEEIGSHRQKRR